MQIVHKKKAASTAASDPGDDWMHAGKLLEQENNNKAAINLYLAVLKKHPHNIYLYDRLMILYRKEKACSKELMLIKRAIGKFSKLFQPKKNKHSKKVANLSKSILHLVGLSDRNGVPLYHPQPISRWEKRKHVVQQKLAAKRKN